MPRTPDFKATRTIPQMISELGRPQPQPETGWHKAGASEANGVDFLNSWAGASGYADPAWYLSEDGEVRFRGRIDGGAEGTIVMVLPEEIRPEFADTWICDMQPTGYAKIEIDTDGTMTVTAMVS